jgi:lauroyl/myristoyl acyltransferase
MKKKNFKQRAVKSAGRALTFFLRIFVKAIPERMFYGFSRILGKLSFIFADERREKTLANLNVAFGNEKSPQEIERIGRQNFHEIVEAGADTVIRLLKDSDLKKTLLEDISVEGAEYLDEALKDKKAYLGGCAFWEFSSPARLSLQVIH